MMGEEKLLPCPFCGNERLLLRNCEYDKTLWLIECNSCRMEFAAKHRDLIHGKKSTREDLVKTFNRREAIAPRLMTPEEIESQEWDYCYLESERLPGKEYRAVCGTWGMNCVTFPSVTRMKQLYGYENYGRKWRCWTARPTDEQRKAVKWE